MSTFVLEVSTKFANFDEEIVIDDVTEFYSATANTFLDSYEQLDGQQTFDRKSFFEKTISKHGMVPLKTLRGFDGWKPEFEQLFQIKRVHICKSCKFKSCKDCCPEYSPSNRVMIKMVVAKEYF